MFQKHNYQHGNNYSGYSNPLNKHTQPSHEKPLLLAFTGKLGSGKSTAAAYINKKYGGVRIPLARGLKVECYDILAALQFGSTIVMVPDAELLDAPHSFAAVVPKLVLPSDDEKVTWIDANKNVLRPLLQYWGTNYRRAQNENYWIDQTISAVEKARDEYCVITIDDARFRNECNALADIGFTIVKMVTGDDERVLRVKQRDDVWINVLDTHASETEQDGLAAHHYINNSAEEHWAWKQLDAMLINILNQEDTNAI
jgi:hypothetical protein